MFQNCPYIQIKNDPVIVTMGQIKRTPVGSMYIITTTCAYITIKIAKVRPVLNLTVDLKDLELKVKQKNVETDSIVVELGCS